LNTKILFALIVGAVASITIGIYTLSTTQAETIPNRALTINQDNPAVGNISNFKTPRYLPAGNTIYDSDVQNTSLALWYSPVNATSTDKDDLILYYVAMDDGGYYSDLISKGKTFLEEYKASSQRGNVMTIFEINGMPAMKWDSGTKNSITQFDDGTVVDVEPVDYPAEVWMIDTKDRAFYTVRGYLPVEELTKIIGSVG